MTGSSTTTANAAAAPALTKDERKQLERTCESLTFLKRIERIRVTETKFYDGYERVLFDVTMKEIEAPLSARQKRKDAKKKRPVVDYSTKKSLLTLKSVHQSVHEWSAKHPEPTAPAGTSLCAYCQQFNSPAALQMWKWSTSVPQQPQQPVTATLSVVDNTSALQKYEQCLMSYVECARRVPDGALESGACPGVLYIPAIVANAVGNDPTMSSAVAYTIVFCQIM